MDQPATQVTLSEALRTGQLPPVQRQLIRAQFSQLDMFQATDIRRAIALLLERITNYYQVIAYTGPGYVYGRVDSEYPSALYAKPDFNYIYQTWSYREMSPTHPTCSIERLYNEAGSMCLQTACKVARAELTAEVSEATELFRIASDAILTMARDREFSEVRWRDSMRRITATGLLKILKRLSSKIAASHVGWDRGLFAAVVPGACEWRLSQYPRVMNWSYGTPHMAAAR